MGWVNPESERTTEIKFPPSVGFELTISWSTVQRVTTELSPLSPTSRSLRLVTVGDGRRWDEADSATYTGHRGDNRGDRLRSIWYCRLASIVAGRAAYENCPAPTMASAVAVLAGRAAPAVIFWRLRHRPALLVMSPASRRSSAVSTRVPPAGLMLVDVTFR